MIDVYEWAKSRASSLNGRAKKLGRPGTVTAEYLAERWLRVRGLCEMCGDPPPPDCHHPCALCDGGASTNENIVFVGKCCHYSLGKQPFSVQLAERFGLKPVLGVDFGFPIAPKKTLSMTIEFFADCVYFIDTHRANMRLTWRGRRPPTNSDVVMDLVRVAAASLGYRFPVAA